MYKGSIRINPRRRVHAYVTVDGISTDIFIDGLPARNRAYEGDIVVCTYIISGMHDEVCRW